MQITITIQANDTREAARLFTALAALNGLTNPPETPSALSQRAGDKTTTGPAVIPKTTPPAPTAHAAKDSGAAPEAMPPAPFPAGRGATAKEGRRVKPVLYTAKGEEISPEMLMEIHGVTRHTVLSALGKARREGKEHVRIGGTKGLLYRLKKSPESLVPSPKKTQDSAGEARTRSRAGTLPVNPNVIGAGAQLAGPAEPRRMGQASWRKM